MTYKQVDAFTLGFSKAFVSVEILTRLNIAYLYIVSI
jgi:hypothetical protein